MPIANHYALTKKQHDILHLLYRFRFATSQQISQTLNIKKPTINKRLQLMLELNYVGRRYGPEYRLLRKHAVYYLMPEGINILKKLNSKQYSSKVLLNMKNKNTIVADKFADHCMAVYDIYHVLRAKHGDSLQFFTKSQMAQADYFPNPLPDAHIQLGTIPPKLFLLELFHEQEPFFKIAWRIAQYLKYADNNEWPEKYDFPKILIVCDTPALHRRLIKRMREKIEGASEEDDELEFFITNLADLKNDNWRNMLDPDKPRRLSSI